ncbi:acetyltransferase [Cyclobacterium xiamenense]|uniref:acetyltransferase n=1 Tax=Cyclobacterium xiamenense TaxID=1297121 RepID=UPI0035CEA1CC
MKVIIVGAGGHAAELVDYIHHSNKIDSLREQIEILGLIDDSSENHLKYDFSYPLLGQISSHQIDKNFFYLMGIANLKYRKKFVEEFIARGANFISYIHPSASVSSTASIGKGVVVAPNVNLGPNSFIGDYSLVNSRVSLGHDTKIGKFNFLSPNVCFSGFTEVGDENLFGINSATIPGIRIGSRNKIMAGMTLEKNVGDDEVVFYRYKERISIIRG